MTEGHPGDKKSGHAEGAAPGDVGDRLRLLARKDAELGGLDLFARLDVPTPGSFLESPERLDDVLDRLRMGITTSLSNPARLHGWHVQIMFAQVVQALNGCLLLKEEDQGSAWARESLELKPADYRIVLPTREHLLVEVKNHHSEDPLTPFSMRGSDLDGFVRYAEVGHGRPLVAIYWARPGFWTLIDPDRFHRRETRAEIGLLEAMPQSEMGILGDMMIGTVPPISFVADVEPTDGPITEASDGTREVPMVIRSVRLEAGGRILTGKVESRLALYLMLNGRWHETMESEFDGNAPKRIRFRFEPEQWPAEQGFAFVGSLSELFTNSFWNRTTTAGRITSLAASIDPAAEGFTIARDYKSDELPLWRVRVVPKSGPSGA
jgi:hypothetical protein